MAFDILPHPAATTIRLVPVASRYAPLFCFALLTVACALASFVFACATPFAAFAVVAAAMLPVQPAVLAVTAAWLINQAIGFGLHHYPVDINTILWGLVIGMAAFAATVTSTIVLRAMRRTGTPVALGLTLISAYAAYELVLLTATPLLGGAGGFTTAVVGRLGILSVLWLIGLVAACEVFRLLTSAVRHQVS